MWTSFNINNYMRVKLTDGGVQAYKHHYRQIHDLMKTPEDKRGPKLDADGYYRDQIWTMMAIFGPILSVGFDSPFTDCKIELEAQD